MRDARVRIFTADKENSNLCSFYDKGQETSHQGREFCTPMNAVLQFLQKLNPSQVYSVTERMNGSEVSQILVYYSGYQRD